MEEQAAEDVADTFDTNPGTDTPDKDGKTALIRSAEAGRLESVQRLIEAGSNVNYAVPELGATALMYAAQNGHAEIVKLLIEKGANVNAGLGIKNIDAKNFGLKVGRRNDCKMCVVAKQVQTPAKRLQDELLSADRSCDEYSIFDRATPLFLAAGNGHTEVVKLLLDAGAKINQATYLGETPLMRAVSAEQLEIVQLLKERGADINAASMNSHANKIVTNDRPHCGRLSRAEYQKRRIYGSPVRRDPKEFNLDGTTALAIALESKNQDIIDYLLDAKADTKVDYALEIAMAYYWTGKHDNEKAYWLGVIKRLAEGGANGNDSAWLYSLNSSAGFECMKRGMPLFVSAVACNMEDVVPALIDAKADVNMVTKTGEYEGLRAMNIVVERKGAFSETSDKLEDSKRVQAAKKMEQLLAAAGAHE